MTDNQAKMLRAIATNEMNAVNGYNPECAEDTGTFADEIIITQADNGTFTSLLNAGLVWHVQDPGRRHGRGDECGMTDAGFEAYKALTL